MAQPGLLPEPIVQRKLIVVEGPDDRRFLEALFRHLGLGTEFQIVQAHGKDRLGPLVRVLPQVSGFAQVETLAVFRDADDDPHAAFQSLCNHLHRAGLNTPSQPAPGRARQALSGHFRLARLSQPRPTGILVPGRYFRGTGHGVCDSLHGLPGTHPTDVAATC